MKWSIFNFLYPSKNDNGWVLYNSLSNVLINMNQDNYEKLISLRENPILINMFSNAKELINSKILVEDDQIEIDKLKLEVLRKRFTNDILDITIVPTLSCNFNCTYCFQDGLPTYIMDDRTEDNIIDFIKLFKSNIKFLQITWFGGEPLLVFDKIKSISKKLINEINIPFESNIITNGYLLDENVIAQLDNLHIKFIQITIDGLEETHNTRRRLHNNKNTFQTIIKNLESVIKLKPEIKISIRVNIDKDNTDEYHKIYKFLLEKFVNNKIVIYPGFVDSYSYKCSSIDFCSLEKNERVNFYIEQYSKYGLYSEEFYPTVNTNSCMVRYLNSYVIGPTGELYKCVSTVGVKEMEIGNINNKDNFIKNDNLLIEFLKGNDYLDRKECNDCIVFPICDGGCPYLKMKEKYLGEQHDICNIAKGNLDKFLDIHIDMKQAK